MKFIESEVDYIIGILDQCEEILDYIYYQDVDFSIKIKLEKPLRDKYYELTKNKNMRPNEIISYIDYYFGKYDLYKDWLNDLSNKDYKLKKDEIKSMSKYAKERMDKTIQQYKDYCQL